MEILVNNATTTLTSTINNSTTSVVVASGAVFPSTGNFRITIDNEIMLVTARSSNTLTVTRGQEGTTAAAHAASSQVRSLLTAGAYDQWFAELIHVDTFANRATVGDTGRLFLASDNNYIERDDGTNWTTYGPLFKFTSPEEQTFAWVNQGTASVSGSNELNLTVLNNASANLRIRKKTAPSTPYSITAFFTCLTPGLNGYDGGLCWRESSSSKLVTVGMVIGSSFCSFRVAKWTNETTYSADYKTVGYHNFVSAFSGIWVKLVDDATNRKVWVSGDGLNWSQFHSVGRTDHMTADEVGFFAGNATATSNGSILTLYSWKEGS